MAESLISIRNLSIDFYTDEGIVHAVKNLNLEIPKGQTIGLVGESGSGKSVTALSILGLIPNPPGVIASGEIIYEGKDLVQMNNDELRDIRGNKVSMIFQEPMTSLNPVYTVGNQIDEAICLHQKVDAKEARHRTIELLREVKIKDPETKVNAYPHQMSGGQKQRVMIAMAMACEPELLICDEPTTALDVTIQKEVLYLMLELQKKHNMSMLFITHDLGVIADIADEVAVMYRGELVEEKTCKKLFEKPEHPYTKGLLACRPRLDRSPARLPMVEDYLSGQLDSSMEIENEAKKALPNDVLLEVNNLKKYFPIKSGFFNRNKSWFQAVDGVSLKVRKGTTMGLVGESGCGKTTLGRSILRLIEPTEGDIEFDGVKIDTLSQEEMRKMRKRMQIIFQDPYASLNPRMTVAAIVTEPMQVYKIGKNKKERMEMAGELLTKVGLSENHLSRYPHEFSGGQRQRICIARALSLNPDFIICDESVSALDVSVQAQVINLLKDLQEEFKLTYIFISHDLSVVKYMSDEVGVMNKGKIVELGAANDIYTNPRDSYTVKLLEAIPKGIPS